MNHNLSTTQYTQLAQDLTTLLEHGRVQAQQAVVWHLLQTYWKMGQRIYQEQINSDTQRGRSILVQLAEDINFPYRTLCYCQTFYQQYPVLPEDTTLTWSHFRELLSIKDQDTRAWYQQQAEEKGLSRDQLAAYIKKQRHEDVVETTSSKTTNSVKRPTEPTYVYKAIVEHVVDGDTIVARIDLGFDTWRSQRLRLAQIDTPPLKQKDGEAARDYVKRVLAPCEWIMIRTNRVDMYARYIADVFYLPGETDKNRVFKEGYHLNAELVEKGLAVVF